jgi:hypothetical protein
MSALRRKLTSLTDPLFPSPQILLRLANFRFRNIPTPCCFPENSVAHLKLVSVFAGSHSGTDDANALRIESTPQEEPAMPGSIIALGRTLCLLCEVLAAFELGEMNASFSGSQWAWMATAGYIIAIVVLSFELLRAIWRVDGTQP